jgi:hypothetical protein
MATIRKMLDLSTGHLPPDLAESLSHAPGVIAYQLEFGWLMWIPDDPDHHARGCGDGPPEQVLLVQRYARSHDCDYVLFDADAEQVADLPHWQW